MLRGFPRRLLHSLQMANAIALDDWGGQPRRPFTPVSCRALLVSAVRSELRAWPSCAPCWSIPTSVSCWLRFEHGRRNPSLALYIRLVQSLGYAYNYKAPATDPASYA